MDPSRELPEQPIARLDPGALAAIVADAMPQLRAFVRLKMGPALRAKETSLDLTQSACAEALAELPRATFHSESDVRRWLFEVAARRAIDKARFHHAARRDVDREVPMGDVHSSASVEHVAQYYSSICSPSEMAIGNEALTRF